MEKWHQARFIHLRIKLTKLRESILECIHIGSPSESIGIGSEEVLQPNKYSIMPENISIYLISDFNIGQLEWFRMPKWSP